MTFHQIFPDIVYKTKIADSEIIKKKFANKIINKFIHDPNEKFVWADLCKTWQVPANEEIKKLFYIYFEQHVHRWLEYYNFPNIKYEVDMWINVHTSNMYQEIHNHIGPSIIISGNYNLQLNKKDSPLLFNKRNTYLDLLSTMGMQLDSKSNHSLDGKEGDLLLFAPDQAHVVPCAKEKHDGHRITISFNVRSS
jgi:hypothetical protein